MTTPFQIDAHQVAAVLYAENHDLTEKEALLLREFVTGAADAEQAQQAIESLGQLRRAA